MAAKRNEPNHTDKLHSFLPSHVLCVLVKIDFRWFLLRKGCVFVAAARKISLN